MSSTSRLSMILAAVLCVAVTLIHIDDQGGVTGFADPAWLGWGYRLLEVGGLAVAAALLASSAGLLDAARTRLVRVAAALLGAGPFVGFVLTRTTGLPGATDDIGSWGEPLGIASLVVEAALVAIALTGLGSPRRTADTHAPARQSVTTR